MNSAKGIRFQVIVKNYNLI